MLDLSGKVALVTGGSKNIGQAITLALTDAGCRTIITYKSDAESALETSRYSNLIYPPIQMDVTNLDSVVEAVAKVGESVGKLDILVNNAGYNYPNDFDNIVWPEWEKVLATNLSGPFVVSKLFWRLLADGAAIVNIGSSSAFTGGPRSTHYSASKLGLVALTQNMALFGARQGIRVNIVAAGYVHSNMADKGMESEVVRKTVERIPLGRLGEPGEVANCVLFLASSLSSYVTGATTHCNGGLYF